MKKHIFLFAIIIAALASCNKTTTYSRQLDAEKQLIKDFIARNNINVLTAWPDSDYVWAENDYLQVPNEDYFYFHLVNRGDMQADTIGNTDEVIFRFRKYTLEQYADTISYWSTMDGANPVTMSISNYATSEWTSMCACEGVVKALKFMNRKNAEAKIICPSKMGIETDSYTVTPYGYDLKIKGIKK